MSFWSKSQYRVCENMLSICSPPFLTSSAATSSSPGLLLFLSSLIAFSTSESKGGGSIVESTIFGGDDSKILPFFLYRLQQYCLHLSFTSSIPQSVVHFHPLLCLYWAWIYFVKLLTPWKRSFKEFVTEFSSIRWHWSFINLSLSFLISLWTVAFWNLYFALSTSFLMPFALNFLLSSTSVRVSLDIHWSFLFLFLTIMLLVAFRKISSPSSQSSFSDFSSSHCNKGSKELEILMRYSLSIDV